MQVYKLPSKSTSISPQRFSWRVHAAASVVADQDSRLQKYDIEKRLDTLEGLWAVRRLVQWSSNPDHYLLTMDSLNEVGLPSACMRILCGLCCIADTTIKSWLAGVPGLHQAC